jgi:hypothetical protein
MTDAAEPKVQRERLIDHFKATYQIVVGIAITIACTNLYADGVIRFPPDISFWTFCIFFITVMPIFHGGDRSLDIKYLHVQPKGFWGRVFYLWDFYALVITGILFVKIAQVIPGAPSSPPIAGQAVAGTTTPASFYLWMTIVLAFDVIVLTVDGIKSDHCKFYGVESKLFKVYGKWIAFNVIFALICVAAIYQPTVCPSLSVTATAAIVFIFAVARTVLDYMFGGEFMFP